MKIENQNAGQKISALYGRLFRMVNLSIFSQKLFNYKQHGKYEESRITNFHHS